MSKFGLREKWTLAIIRNLYRWIIRRVIKRIMTFWDFRKRIKNKEKHIGKFLRIKFD